MNIKSITASGLLMLAATTGWSQTSDDNRLMWYEPADAKQNEEITVYFNASCGQGGLKDFTGDVYAHTGVLTTESTSNKDWKHAPSWCDNDAKYRFTRSASDPNLYSWTITPSTFYGLYSGETITSLCFVMRDEKGNKSDNSDIIVPFTGGGGGDDIITALGAYVSHASDGSSVTVTAQHGTLTLTAYNDYVIKVFTLPAGDSSQERQSITVSAAPEATFSVSEDDDNLTLSTAATQVIVNKANCAVSFADMAGSVRLSEKEGLNNSVRPHRVTFNPMNDAAFYGGGYNGQRADQSDCTIVMDNHQQWGWNADYSDTRNICIPFVVSTSGYGLLFDDHYRGAKITPSSTRGTTYETGSLNPIAYYYVGGDGSMASVMENYTFLTGRQELPPYWALGYITSRYGYKTQQEAREVINKIKGANLPLDGIVMDLYWQGYDESGMGNLDWYSSNWPNPTEMMRDFDEKVSRPC